ncbi:TetR/AcrR family transcriptional regulator [Paenibacillus jilunlii]|uniref:TetR family transcriptional regulator n=1 Tax=Paenibacillus jilunlii TaxID=682956 RepID=A0A1G9RKF6_9BACL|nr:TetR/AcrR family transcriptional regulator [Paenibacillus jilunlii]KWX79622.1 TetR family transcriptional regulator [Paenibacillus jilunlii]SDM23540.1 transcriptional regulator, TetR family [Paenibacillus jilunlii]
MNKFEIRTQIKKDAIIAAALKLFREKGFIDVSIKDIAAESGVSSVSLYNYFGNKEGVVRECTNVLMQNTVRKAKELLSQNINFKDKMLQALEICADQDYQLLSSPGAVGDQVLSSLYNENTNRIRVEIIEEFIRVGKKEGVIDNSVSIETILELLCAIGLLQSSWVKKENYKDKMAELNRLLLFGLIGRQ